MALENKSITKLTTWFFFLFIASSCGSSFSERYMYWVILFGYDRISTIDYGAFGKFPVQFTV